MAQSQYLSFQGWPTTPGCLSWSSDTELAIAVGESVDILTPRLALSLGSKKSENDKWQRVRLTVNRFHESELPLLDPLPWGTFSVGEEQSLGSAVSLAWAPPGLVKYRRCALAVLTSNYELSIWAPMMGAKSQNGWARISALNLCLRKYFIDLLEHASLSRGGIRDDFTWRARSRIKAFAFAPQMLAADLVNVNLPRSEGLFVVTANDLNELVVIYVENNAVKTGIVDNASLEASVDLVVAVPAVSNQVEYSPEPPDRASALSDVAWSPWWPAKKTCVSKIAYIISGELRLRGCCVENVNGRPKLSMSEHEVTVAGIHVGPLHWSISVLHNVMSPGVIELIHE